MDEEPAHRCPVRMVVAAVVLVALRVKPQELERADKEQTVVHLAIRFLRSEEAVEVEQLLRVQMVVQQLAQAELAMHLAMAIRLRVAEVVVQLEEPEEPEEAEEAERVAAQPQRQLTAEHIRLVGKPSERVVVVAVLAAILLPASVELVRMVLS